MLWTEPRRQWRGRYCPLCGKSRKDFLSHIRLDHEIEDAEQFVQAMDKLTKNKERMIQFATYAQELWDKKTKGLISAEEYRRLTMEWTKQHE
jgi:hypothetical protein